MVTDNLIFPGVVDELHILRGRRRIYIWRDGDFNDIGELLAAKIVVMAPRLKAPLVEPINKIRATVIGAGAYSLSIFRIIWIMDERLSFPMRNIPVLRS